MDQDKDWKTYQFRKELGYPVYLKFDPAELDSHFVNVISELGFEESDSDDASSTNSSEYAKVLQINLASSKIANRIGQYTFEDQFGPESVTPRMGYKLYRYKGVGLLIFSLTAANWELGVLDGFGSTGKEQETKVILNRYLSWALSLHNVVGFWGVPVDEGIVIMNQGEALAECVFLDTINQRLISVEGIRRFSHPFQILRLDKTLKGKNLGMSREELIGFLTNRTSYFDYNGVSTPVKQQIRAVASVGSGIVYPYENYKPRTNLSY